MTTLSELLAPVFETLPAHLSGADAEGRIEYLRARLLEPDVDIQDVWDYCALQHQPNPGMEMQSLASFVDEQALANFHWLHSWWAPVPDKPTTLPTPTIMQFCWYINHSPGAAPVTFDMALQQFHARCIQHCKTQGVDPDNPTESADERRKRRNRERMAATRGHRRTPERLIKHDEALAAQVRGLESECDAIKLQAKDQDEQWREVVLGHQTAMVGASNKRKEVAAGYKQRIEALRAQIRNLTAKQ